MALTLDRDLACGARDFELRIPLLPDRLLLAREVRVPVSLARPERDALRFARAPLLRVEADREELRPRLSLARAVVFRREERPSLRFWFRARVVPVLRVLTPEVDAPRDLELA